VKKLIFISVLFCALETSAQNLIPNGDFEYYTTCPTAPGQASFAFPWIGPLESSDYFNSCAPVSSFVNVPNQTIGLWQYARSGVGYMGIWSYGGGKEYIQVALTDTLRLNKCYSVTFYANLQNEMQIGANNLGAYISQTSFLTAIGGVYNYTPQIMLPGNPPIIDTINWVKISGLYHASGGEGYITIGNFNYDSATVTQVVNASNPVPYSYYYIDDVSIYEIKMSNAGRDTAICHGDSVMLGTTNYEGVTYNWLPTAGLSNASIGNPMASPTTTTTYYLTQTTPCATTADSVVVSLGDCTVGVQEYNNSEITIFPNPTSSTFTTTSTDKIQTVKIYNIIGELLITETINNTQSTININQFSKGIYFAEIKTEKGVVRKKIVRE